MFLFLITAGEVPGLGQVPPNSAPASSGWDEAAGELAAKIVARAAPQTALALVVRNASSLSDDDVSRIRRALRSELRGRRIHLTTSKRAGAEVQVTLSENVEGLVWIAEIRKGASTDVGMESVARPKPGSQQATEELLSVRKSRVFEQAEPMLDVVPLAREAAGAAPPGPARILVLGAGAVSLFAKAAPADKARAGDGQEAAWQVKASAQIPRRLPWPRDLRGRLVAGAGNQFQAYLPGEVCSGNLEPLSVECHEADDPWPLGAVASSALHAYFAPDRNYFDGRIRLDDGREVKAPPFFAAAILPAGNEAGKAGGGEGNSMWLLTGLDGRAQVLSGGEASAANIGGWGSELVGVTTGCRSGWQALTTGSGDFTGSDTVQAYEIIGHHAVIASLPVEFAGPVTALWPLANGSEALAISHNMKTGDYEAFRLSVTCNE